MKRDVLFLLTVLAVIFVSCVDDYEDANPTRLLDSPAVLTVMVSNDTIEQGTTTDITLTVSDAPAGLDSIAVSAVSDGEPAGGSFSLPDVSGLTSGEITVSYTAPSPFSGDIDITVTLYDGQTDEDGDLARKSSVPETVSVNVFCNAETVSYDVNGTILVDDFGSGPYDATESVIFVSCINEYQVSDITGGLYTGSYADPDDGYGTSGRAATLEIDSETGDVTWSDVSDQFGGEIIQDPAQPTSNIDGDGVITVYWTATAYGERGVTTYTPN